MKPNKLHPINNENYLLYLNATDNLTNLNTFLSSCFKYYYGNVTIQQNSKVSKLQYSTSFLTTVKYNQIIIIDYANIMHILFEQYNNNFELASLHFYKFILTQLKKKNKIIIISKTIVLTGAQYDVLHVLNIGKQMAKETIKSKYFVSEQLCIYNLEYTAKLSSSVDDLLQYFLTFIMFVYLLDNNKDPSSNNSTLQKLQLITNDKQRFDKNLFGKTDEERKAKIKYLYDLLYSKVSISNGEFVLTHNTIEQLLLRQFFSNYVRENIKDVDNLECNLTVLLELLHQNKVNYGYFMNNSKEYNPNFKKTNFTRKKLPNFSYNNLNYNQKKNRKSMKICKSNHSLERNQNLKRNYYLYAFIKYIQLYQNTIHHNGEEYGDFFGSFDREQIVKLFS